MSLRSKILIFTALGSALLSSCSQKGRKSNWNEDRRGESSIEGAQKFYYTDLQIVSESKPVGDCADENQLTTRIEQEPTVILNDANELDGPGAYRQYAVNVSMQIMGFDQAKFVFTSLDGQIPKEIPFKMKLRRLPGLILELQFLDQTLSMRLRDTPVYSFTATETRGSCTIEHHINVFGEHTGFYKPAAH